MVASIRLSEQGLQQVDMARRKKGWNVTAHSWCEAAHTSPATLRRFRQRQPIQQDAFIRICQAVGVSWENVVDDTLPTVTSESTWLFVLSATIPEIDRAKADAIVAVANQLLGEGCKVILNKIELGSVVLVLSSPLEGFERIEYLFRTRQLREILGFPVEDVRLASAPINWRQFLQNLFEPYWQQPEQLLPAGAHRSAEGSNAPEAILNLIHLLQTSQDEPTRRQAAEALGKTGTGNPHGISALTQLLRNSQDPETLWQAALSLGKLDPGNPAAGVERAKALDLGTQPDSQAVALIAAFRPKTDGEVSIRLRVEPVEEGQIYLPPHLKLTVFDESGEAFIQTESTSRDNFLQRGFSGPPGLQFSVTISLGDASITEEFLT
ncbi:MAG: DUF1822 family protein [Oscillatoria princeps RMCB-10]|jgi:hypothetical protein|nr:DUF1822 family protein [Oscillatoria princeps RMCB-10]